MKSERAQRLLTLLVLAVLVLAPLAGTVAAGPDTRPPAALSTSLVAYWKLDEASGTRLDELNGCGGSGCDLTDNNTVTSNTGIISSAGQFTAANSEYLSHADDATLSAGDIDFTIVTWVNVDSNPRQVVIGKGNAGSWSSVEYSLDILDDGGVLFTVGNGSTYGTVISGAGSVTPGNWVSVVAWHDATNDVLGLQINNGTPATSSYASGSFDSTDAVTIGRWPGYAGAYFDGRIDEVGFWKRVLTSGERTSLYNGGAGCTYPFTACEATPTPTSTATATATTFTATPTSSPTVTTTPLPTDTPTATATTTSTPTATPPYLTVATLDSGRVVWLERRATFGDLAVFSALIVLIALTGLRWTYQLAKELMS